MRRLAIMGIALLAAAGCDPYHFGFKNNPAFVLDMAYKSIQNLDLDSFLEVTAKEALCVYGNEEGLHYLKQNLTISPDQIKLKPTKLNSLHYSTPIYVDYWSYYHERYSIEILEKNTGKAVLKTIIDCEFGTSGSKNEKFIKKDPESYEMKECRVVKVFTQDFKDLPLPKKCGPYQVTL
jgi:phosphomannomutase